MIDSLETGGSERQFAALARSLQSSCFFSLSLACIQKRGAFLDQLEPMKQFDLGRSLYGLHSLYTRIRLARYLRESETAVAHSFDFYSNLALIPAARLAGLAAVIGSQRQLGDLLTRRQELVQAAAFRLCDRVVCNSHAAADRLIGLGLEPRKIAIIYNGLAPAAFESAAPALPVRPGLLRVGMIARMNSPAKNHRALLAAARRLSPHLLDNLEIVFAGDGPLRSSLETEANSLGLALRVIFLGDRRDIPAILASLDVSVLPSASESLSNAIIESMAAGVSVVASRAGGNPELLSDQRGLLIAPGSEQELTLALERLLSDSSLRQGLARNARKFAAANFTIELMHKRHEELYAEVLDSKLRRQIRLRRVAGSGG